MFYWLVLFCRDDVNTVRLPSDRDVNWRVHVQGEILSQNTESKLLVSAPSCKTESYRLQKWQKEKKRKEQRKKERKKESGFLEILGIGHAAAQTNYSIKIK